MSATSSSFSRVLALAEQRAVHLAFQWLHLQQRLLLQWQEELVAIPAPPFGEARRSTWCAEHFRKAGLEDVSIDPIGNVTGLIPAAPMENENPEQPCILLSAHIDTVFPSDTPLNPLVKGTRLEAPGATDNAAGVIAMLAIAYALRQANYTPACHLLFAANVGEEGEGDLRGIRYLYQASEYKSRIVANVVLDGAGHETVVSQALGSRRFQVTITGPGGHSFSDAGTPNPIAALATAIARMAEIRIPSEPCTTLNFGIIEGGTSVNSIPERASASFDFRSVSSEELLRLEVALHRAVEDSVLATNNLPQSRSAQSKGLLRFQIEKIGDRPAATLPSNSIMLESLRAVDRHLHIHTETRIGSTDANIPMSLGIPAVSLGAGGDGGNPHTRAEWYDATNRELGLRRILLLTLTLLDTTGNP